jgi:hypothetical protein
MKGIFCTLSNTGMVSASPLTAKEAVGVGSLDGLAASILGVTAITVGNTWVVSVAPHALHIPTRLIKRNIRKMVVASTLFFAISNLSVIPIFPAIALGDCQF